ncbi:MAG: N-acetylneuraminate synthase [Bacteroidota bacterium]
MFKIGKDKIGKDQPCFVIAEAGVNHNGNLETALELVRKAKEVGANCVKFQTFKADSVITRDAPKADYQLKVTSAKESQFEMLKKLELSKADFRKISDYCKEINITFLSTPYNKRDADLLYSLNVDAFKIASGQLVELSFLSYVAKFKKPIIISTGMATLAEVDDAVRAIRHAGNNEIVVLQCTTNYPSDISEANIKAMGSMGKSFDLYYGYSDHVSENYACYAAVALGAKVVEKHFTLDKSMRGPDHSASLDVVEFKNLISGIRAVESSLGSSVKSPTTSELKNISGMRRSIVANQLIHAGTIIKESMLEFKRPGTGIPPNQIDLFINKKAKQDILQDALITFSMIEW